MWFLVKAAFWFSLVLVLLPFLDPSSGAKLENGPKVEIGDTFSAANEAFQYISAICIQKPDVCTKGAETFVALGHRAREGARIAYEFLDSQFAEAEAPDAKVMTGTVAPAESLLAVEPANEAMPVFKRTPVPEKRLDPKATSAK
ncbi:MULTISPECIES: DUF5330 domain-containing protein [Sinorhizobium]|uniref:DUF5330 domain-containing protein n=2 Tax=Sinorhizobium TaxID=28105 RepID=A0A2S3YHD4_9HYPH|nr:MULTISPECIES: DUF5330 domain-containing protein [Sinorhizobium]AUX75618.1 hypothetical protein NXT3_CH01023 [Sinorhizobium fredii]PDT40561.1 hypothetical protein CO656_14535 [Sinorhizobium sp. FG01]PDT52346.1 hypothetical protein CO664_16130 [Sinorhizobium sp. NG07B]POH26160.1 hypothetical protein ATY31_24265 [Sinorhizobium americanum]POH28078.1 hypothetical protein ATY30_20645 [Sinorhizobium americanum]